MGRKSKGRKKSRGEKKLPSRRISDILSEERMLHFLASSCRNNSKVSVDLFHVSATSLRAEKKEGKLLAMDASLERMILQEENENGDKVLVPMEDVKRITFPNSADLLLME